MKLFANLTLLREAEKALQVVADRHGLVVSCEWDEGDFWKVRFWAPPDMNLPAPTGTDGEKAQGSSE